MFFFHDYANTFYVVPVQVETDKEVFLNNYLERLITKTKDIFSEEYRREKAEARRRAEDFIRASSGWYIYLELEPSCNSAILRGSDSPESEIVKSLLTAEGLAVREKYDER